jgi:membrane associated rhomboid family serine protease
MFPIRDTTPSKNYPVVNNTIIGICAAVFLIELSQGAGLDHFIYIYGIVPARYSVDRISYYFTFKQQFFSLLSFMFLHGGFWHLISNMLFLYIFGDNVEDRLGHINYLLFYIACGITSGLCHLTFNIQSNTPTIGASGAVAGVMGAYLILYPRSKILTLIPIIFIPYFIELPAFFFIGSWFVLQLLNAASSLGSASHIAWWAHIGGFVFGIIFLKLSPFIPGTKFSDKMRMTTKKRKTPRLQVIRPVGPGYDHNLYGTIIITPHEALTGTRKMVNIPWGFNNKFYNIKIPQGIKGGNTLRLKELGKLSPTGAKGDLMLKVTIQS